MKIWFLLILQEVFTVSSGGNLIFLLLLSGTLQVDVIFTVYCNTGS